MFSKGRMVVINFEINQEIHRTTVWTTALDLVSQEAFGCALRDFYARLGADLVSVNMIEMTEGSININQISRQALVDRCGEPNSQAQTCKLDTAAMS